MQATSDNPWLTLTQTDFPQGEVKPTREAKTSHRVLVILTVALLLSLFGLVYAVNSIHAPAPTGHVSVSAPTVPVAPVAAPAPASTSVPAAPSGNYAS